MRRIDVLTTAFAAVVAIVAVAAAACSVRLEFPEWTLDVPEGTRVWTAAPRYR